MPKTGPRVTFHIPDGRYLSSGEAYEVADWPEGWPVPRVGEVVYTTNNYPLVVSQVCWYPSADHAYVILKAR